MKKKAIFTLLLVLLVLVFDQVFKIWIKTNMYLSEEISVFGDWFILHFTENNGFAFGTEIGGKYGKLGLSLFRLVAVGLIAYYLIGLFKEKVRTGYVLMVGLVFAGAVGNIIDSTFYGLIFNESMYGGPVATMFPDGGGYASLFHGKVVDMLYFPVLRTVLPEWVPFWGGEYFVFFRPVFNIADTAITTGVFTILVFYRAELKSFGEKPKTAEDTNTESAEK